MTKRIMPALLALALLLSATPAASAYAWRMTNKTIVFTGTGEISHSNSWREYQFAAATAIEVQEGLTSLPDSAFSGMEKVTKVSLADTVTDIGDHAFNNCIALGGITLPAKLTSLGEYAFKNCNTLRSISVPEGVTAIRNGTFYGCALLESVELRGAVTFIGAKAFKGCTKLSVFAVPQGVGRLHSEAFAYCTGLVQVYLPAGMKQVDADVFAGCSGLTDIYYGGSRVQWEQMNIQDEVLLHGGITVHYNAKAADLDENAQVSSGTASLRFDDVLPDYWGYQSVLSIAEHGLVSGTRQPDANGVGSFSPEGKVTLGQFLVVITRLVCPEARRDTPGHWARGSYNAALETGIIAKGDFYDTDEALDAPLKRQNMAHILVRAARLQGETFSVHPDAKASIRDFGQIEENRRQAVLECYSNGIISGYSDGDFGPNATMTRAQMAVVVCRLAGWQSRAEVKF